VRAIAAAEASAMPPAMRLVSFFFIKSLLCAMNWAVRRRPRGEDFVS
jgi:hypothetical protein